MPEGNKSFVNNINEIWDLEKKTNILFKDNKKIYKTLNWEIPKEEFEIFKQNILNWKKIKIIFNKISPKTKQILEENWIKWIKWHQIDYNIKHIYKWHWEKANLSKWEIPVTDNDLRKIPKIILEADNVSLSPYLSWNWEKIIIYEKTMWNKYYYLEYIPTKWKLLSPKTMYINKIKKD